MMAVMVALVFTNVVTRYVFGFSVTWAEEFSQYLMVWIAFVGAGLAWRQSLRLFATLYLVGSVTPGRAAYVCTSGAGEVPTMSTLNPGTRSRNGS